MAFNGQFQFILCHAAAIISNRNQVLSTLPEGNINAGCAGIHSIFYQLFHHGSRAFYYLAGSDAVYHDLWQDTYRHNSNETLY